MVQNYFESRLQEIGITIDQAASYGLHCKKNGDISIRSFHPDGSTITYTPQKTISAYNRRKTFTDIDLQEIPLTVIRYTPDNHKKLNESLKKKQGKYKYPPGAPLQPSFTPLFSDRYNSDQTGGHWIATEGHIKAISIDVNARIPAIAYNGIGSFKITEDIQEAIVRKEPDTFTVLYDNDTHDLSTKQGEVIQTARTFAFYNSVCSVAEQFFDFQKESGSKTQLFFAMVAPGLPEKGIDDLFAAHPDKVPEIIKELQTARQKRSFRGNWILSFRLVKKKYKKQLQDFWSNSNQVEFYKRYKDQIGEKPFKFQGGIYQQTTAKAADLFSNAPTCLELRNDPFKVEFGADEKTTITIERYLSEQADTVKSLLKQHKLIAISADTGTGKTSIFTGRIHTSKGIRKVIRGILEEMGEKILVALPTIMQTQQTANEIPGVKAIHGRPERLDIEQALNSQIVVCTYDTAKHIQDIANRTLIIDEAHNFVNQLGTVDEQGRMEKPFREKVLNKLLNLTERAKRSVFISGTMPEGLVKDLKFHYLKVKRKESPKRQLRHIESSSRSKESIQATLLTRLSKLQYTGTVFVYYNNTSELESIRQAVIKQGKLRNNEIAVITRPHVNTGETKVYNQIAHGSRISDDIKLVLCSCMIAEGVNINNEKVQCLFIVNSNSIESSRQFPERFRKVNNLDIYCIRPPETALPRQFFWKTEERTQHLKASAKLQLSAVKKELELHDEEFADDEFAFDLHRKHLDYQHRADLYPLVRCKEPGFYEVDILRIYAAEKARQEKYMNNAYYYQKLCEFDGVEMAGSEEVSGDEEQLVASDLKEVNKDIRIAKKEAIGNIQKALRHCPEIVIGAYFLYCNSTSNRNATKAIRQRVPKFIPEPNSEAHQLCFDFLQQHKHYFIGNWVQRLINAYIKLQWIGAHQAYFDKHIFDEWNEREFARIWRVFATYMDAEAYKDKYVRRQMKVEHKAEIKALTLIAKDLADETEIRTGKLYEILDKWLSRYITDSVKQSAVRFTRQGALSLVESLFLVKTHHFIRYDRIELRGQYGIDIPPPLHDHSLPTIKLVDWIRGK